MTALVISKTNILAGEGTAEIVGRPTRGKFWFVNPELRPYMGQFQEAMDKLGSLSAQSLQRWRQEVMKPETPLPDVAWDKRLVPGRRGQPDVTLYVVNSKPGTARAGILHTHGGGFVLGSVEGVLPWLQRLARALECCIVSVAYRLAPETTFLGSTEDNYAGLLWLYGNAAELGVDPARIAVMGESAGGCHAALLAIAARDRGEVPLVFQCLTYPMLDDRTGSLRKVASPVGTLGWTANSNEFAWRSFLGQTPGTARVPPSAVPARQPRLEGLPAAWIGVGSIDLFVEEDIGYARRLIEASVPTELLVVPGAPHGFDNFPGLKLAETLQASRLNALKDALGA